MMNDAFPSDYIGGKQYLVRFLADSQSFDLTAVPIPAQLAHQPPALLERFHRSEGTKVSHRRHARHRFPRASQYTGGGAAQKGHRLGHLPTIFRYAKTYSHREGWKPLPWGMGARHA
jgi:hypothetical protein